MGPNTESKGVDAVGAQNKFADVNPHGHIPHTAKVAVVIGANIPATQEQLANPFLKKKGTAGWRGFHVLTLGRWVTRGGTLHRFPFRDPLVCKWIQVQTFTAPPVSYRNEGMPATR